MSLSTRQPTLLSMLTQPSPTSEPNTPTKTIPTPTAQESPNRTELEPTPLLLALDMEAERKRLRRRTDSVLTGAEQHIPAKTTEVEKVEEEKEKIAKAGLTEESSEVGKQVIIPVKEDLSQLALLGQTINNGFWNGVEGVRKSVWGIAGWS